MFEFSKGGVKLEFNNLYLHSYFNQALGFYDELIFEKDL